MADIIKIDTEKLNSTISDMDSDMEQISSLINQIYQDMKQLDSMWEGPANSIFNIQFERDHEMFQRLCGSIDGYIKSLDYAKKEYIKCENNVDEIVRSIRI